MTKKIRKPRNKATLSSSANSATEPPLNPIDNSSSSRNEKPHSGGNNKVSTTMTENFLLDLSNDIGQLLTDYLTGTQVLKLLVATNELNLHKLSNYIQPHLINNQVEYLMSEPVEILKTVHQYEVFENLRKHCLEVICENPRILFESPNIKSLEKELIILLLKQDELGMEESDIWDFILKWGRSKVSNPLDNDVSNWTSNDFEELEKIICDLIPHVRWIQISSKMFLREYLLLTPSNNNQIGWGSTSHSFLFTFAKNDLNSGYIARVSKDIEIQKNAVYYKSDFGPAFGNLSIIDKSIHRNNDPDVYQNMNRILSDTKNIVDYEVYQVNVDNEAEASRVEG
ncbi:2117_t:CDS:2 [Funneliformis caledonium]|uniref:2117_t:CDS:1 n=1 Tax=Funneliformis caledonium TaxID=1117310 RepID=A0A9N8VVV9_9GLOM|nr:2117_t:CDS:2 [Funneliformis caledonium]